MLISPSPSRSAWLIMSWSSSSSMFSPSSSATRARLRKEILLVLSSSNNLNTFSMSELLSNTGEVAEGDLVGVVVIKQLEHLLDVLAGVLLTHLASHHLEELSKLDGAVTVVVDVSNHLLELLVLDFEAESAHGGLKLTDINGAGGIRVEEGEGFTDLVELLLGELTGFLLGSTA